MPFGPDCEYRDHADCVRSNQDKRDPDAWCAEVRRRTEEHCNPASAAETTPGGAMSERARLELKAIDEVDQAVARFLIDVEVAARSALDSPVVLASSPPPDPLSRSLIRRIWASLTERYPVITELSDEIPAKVYDATASLLRQTASFVNSGTLKILTRKLSGLLSFESPSGPDWRALARNNARTVATRRFNQSQHRKLSAQGHTRKRWVAHHDEHTRDTHRNADGQTVATHEKFQVGVTLMSYPGDPSGPPGETYNCRCVVIGV